MEAAEKPKDGEETGGRTAKQCESCVTHQSNIASPHLVKSASSRRIRSSKPKLNDSRKTFHRAESGGRCTVIIVNEPLCNSLALPLRRSSFGRSYFFQALFLRSLQMAGVKWRLKIIRNKLNDHHIQQIRHGDKHLQISQPA